MITTNVSSRPFQWRHFQFFDRDEIEEPPACFTDSDLIGAVQCKGYICLGTSRGEVHLVDGRLDVRSFVVHAEEEERLTHLKSLDGQGRLVTLSEEIGTGNSPTIRIWKLGKSISDGEPVLLKTIHVQHNSSGATYPVTTFDVLENLTQIAMGFADGKVILLRGQLLKDKHPKQRTVWSSEEPVTGLALYERSNQIYLYITTLLKTVVCNTTTAKEQQTVIDEHGCALGCGVLNTMSGDLVLGREEAIFSYTPEGRGSCYAFEGPKTAMIWHGTYLVILHDDASNTQVTLFDPLQKYIAYSDEIRSGIRATVSASGGLFLISNNGKLYYLQEQETSVKMETLYKQHLYVLAVSLARRSPGYDQESIAQIYRRYGDHLHGKGDYDGAITQYLKTMGYLESSYVVRKFLDAQRIRHLTAYLQELHKRGYATADHTTLLINCYTKLNDAEKLAEFIKSESDTVQFDVETAIRVCRQGGYYDLALHLTKKFKDHATHLKVLIDNVKRFSEALDYIYTLPSNEIDQFMRQYAKIFLEQLPDRTIQLLIELCTGELNQSRNKNTTNNTTGRTGELQGVAGFSLSAVYNRKPNDVSPTSNGVDGSSTMPTSDTLTYAPSPRQFFGAFAGNNDALVKFLEGVAARRWPGGEENDEDERRLIYGTLLELYLTPCELDNVNAEEENNRRTARAVSMLNNPTIPLDLDHALILCRMADFDQGQVIIYERREMYDEIMRFWMRNENVDKIMEALDLYGSKDTSLYALALTYLADNPPVLSAHPEMLRMVMKRVDQENLMPLLKVLQLLCRNSATTVGMIRDFLCTRLEGEQNQQEEDEAYIQRCREETARKKTELAELNEGIRVFQVTRCSSCSGALDLPVIHFMCRHSYHQRCLPSGNTNARCPKCAPELERMQEMRQRSEELIKRHAQFYQELERSDDGFSVAAEYFGSDIFGTHETR